MDLKEVKKIIEFMKENDLGLFSMKREDFEIKLKKNPDSKAIGQLLNQRRSGEPERGEGQDFSRPGQPATAPAGFREITSPMVGTFYRAPSPEAEPFVKVGDTVQADTTVCVIEAMKVMNEIKAEQSGTIKSVLVEDSSAIQYGETLFLLE